MSLKTYFILVEHRDGGDPALISIHATKEKRDERVQTAMFGSPLEAEDHAEELAHALKELNEDGWLRFEGDPPLQYINAIVEAGALDWFNIQHQ